MTGKSGRACLFALGKVLGQFCDAMRLIGGVWWERLLWGKTVKNEPHPMPNRLPSAKQSPRNNPSHHTTPTNHSALHNWRRPFHFANCMARHAHHNKSKSDATWTSAHAKRYTSSCIFQFHPCFLASQYLSARFWPTSCKVSLGQGNPLPSCYRNLKRIVY